MVNVNLNSNADRQVELEEFVQNEGGEKVVERIKKIKAALSQAGFNLGTRTTDSALLGIVFGIEVNEEEEEEEEEDQEEPSQEADIYRFAKEIKPTAVSDRVGKIKGLFAANGIGLTRTTLAACRLISDSFKL